MSNKPTDRPAAARHGGEAAASPGAPTAIAKSVRSLLIVCHANVSRSVMAEAILRRLLAQREAGDRFSIESGGIAYYARDGALASLDARLALEEIGIEIAADTVSTDLKRHRHLVSGADVIFAMTAEQVSMLHEGFPEAHGKAIYTLKEFAGHAGDIDDPQGQDTSVFNACRDEILDCWHRSIERLLGTC